MNTGDDEMETIEMDTTGENGETNDDTKPGTSEVYLPGKPLEEGEELVHDSSAYHMYHVVSLHFQTLRKIKFVTNHSIP